MAVELEDAQASVDVAAMLQPGKRLLPRVATLGERDRTVGQAGLGGQYPVVDLGPPARCASEDAQTLELGIRWVGRDRAVEDLYSRNPVVVVRDPFGAAEHDRRGVLLGLDLALRSDPHPPQMSQDRRAELGLGQQQEVVFAPPPDEQRRDHAALRRQDQRLARVGREDVVGNDPLQQVGGIGSRNPDVGARPDVRPGGDLLHPG